MSYKMTKTSTFDAMIVTPYTPVQNALYMMYNSKSPRITQKTYFAAKKCKLQRSLGNLKIESLQQLVSSVSYCHIVNRECNQLCCANCDIPSILARLCKLCVFSQPSSADERGLIFKVFLERGCASSLSSGMGFKYTCLEESGKLL